tara:strand:- start:406 stop:639 length:234 start_codon:yes stop_codon:yes gene_type:complete
MSTFLKVEGYTDLVRDTNSGAVINTSRSAFLTAKKRSQEAMKHKDQMRAACREINTLKSEMHEIKNLLKKMVEKNGD